MIIRNGLLTFVLSVLVVFSGFAQKTKQPLTVWMISFPQPAQDAIDAWAKQNPDVDLQMSYFGSEDLKTQTRLALNSKKVPDIMMTNAGSVFWEYVDKGAAADLTAAAKSNNWAARGDKSYYDVFRRDGKLYAVPVTGVNTWQTLYLNKKIFDDNKIKVPKTVDDLIAASKQLRQKNIQMIAYGVKDGWPGVIALGDFFLQQGSFDLVAKLNDGTLKWANCAPMRNSLNTIVKLAKNDVFMSGYLSSDHNMAIQSWAAGKTAALYNGSWWYQVTQTTDLGFPIEAIPLPLSNASDKLKGAQLAADMCLFVSPETKSMDAATRFLDFMTDKPYQKIYNEASGSFPIYPGLLSEMKIPALFKSDAIQQQLKLPPTNVYFDWAFPVPVVEVLKTSIQQAMQGKITVDQVLKQAQDKTDEVLKKK